MTKLTIEDVLDKVKNKDYQPKVEYPIRPEGYKKENYVYDENQTVKWNREHREELEKEYQEKLKEYNNISNSKEKEFFLDLSKAIHNRYNLSIPTVELIINNSWEKGHADGYDEVINYVYEFADFAEYVVKHIDD